jgi:UDP-N-acetylmuramate dehydrogenase
MNMADTKHLAISGLRGSLRERVDMRKHTSWRAGGVAERLYRPADLQDLRVFLRGIPPDEPLYPVGLGSNLLVRDGGLPGTVLLLHAGLNELRIEADGRVYAEAGVPGAKLARFAALHEMRGAEFFAGIPGTLGGMLAMNAGCYGSETWQKVSTVITVDRSGELKVRTRDDYDVTYRRVVATADERQTATAGTQQVFTLTPFLRVRELFVAARMIFQKGDADAARQEIKSLLSKRIATQPLNLPNAGSVFRNPPGDYAARLIEQCGLKGMQIGGARVSDKHANFIVNVGNATATEIEALIHHVQRTVMRDTGIDLHPEVRIIGETKA